MNISHRDITPQNIVKVGSIYKVIDLDVGRSFEEVNKKPNEKIEFETLKGH